MRPIVAVVIVILLGSMQTPSSRPSFAGRWRLTDPSSASAMIAPELLVTESSTPAIMTIEQRFQSGVRFVHYSIEDLGVPASPGLDANGASQRPGFQKVAMWTGSALVMQPASEEAWSMTANDMLSIDLTERAFGGTSKTTHASYARIPRPVSVPPGQNLLENALADQAMTSWLSSGNAKIEPCGRNPCFVVRDRGQFQQTVVLPKDVAGKYLAVVGSGATERINQDGAITGLPSLYALVLADDGGRILAHLQGQNMLVRPTTPDTWSKGSGIFRMPEGAARISFQLSQAERSGVPQNGSAARFDDLGLAIFSTESAARAFVAVWKGRDGPDRP